MRSISRRTLIGALVVVPVLVLAPAAGAVTLIGSGSSAAQPYMLKLFKGYSAIHKSVHFRYSPDGGNAGVQDVQQGRSQFAINTRPPLRSDSGTTYFKLYLSGLCIVDNPQNALSDISIAETKNIFLATDTNWSQVPGSNLTTTIDPVGRNSAAGTYTFFQQAVLGGKTQASNVNPLPADGLVANAVSRDPNAIGYVGLAWQRGVKPLKVNGVPCTPSKISVEPLKYPLSRYLFIVLPGDGSQSPPALLKFIDWMRRSPLAGEVISKAGGVPAFNKKRKK